MTAKRRRRHAGIAGRIGGRCRQAVRAIRQRRRRIAPGAAAIGHRTAQQRRTVKHLDRCVGFRRAGQRQDVRSGDAVTNGAGIGRERGDARRHRRRGVDGDASAADATPVLPAASVAVAVRLWAPFASAAVV